MLVVEQNQAIRLSRGDDESLLVTISAGTVADGDAFYLGVKNTPSDTANILTVGPVAPGAGATDFSFSFTSGMTINLPAGNYYYDICRIAPDNKISHLVFASRFALEEIIYNV